MGVWNFLDDLLKRGKDKIENLMMEELETMPTEGQAALKTGVLYQIKDVVSLYIKMEDSRELTGQENINVAAEIRQLFIVKLSDILKEFNAGFIDIKGNGGFALWKEKFGSVKALLAGVTFESFLEKELPKYVKNRIADWTVLSKIGIVKGEILFKKAENRDAQKNKSNWAVWVGDTINFSSKLSDSATGNMILVAENILSDFLSPPELSQYLISSCGCHAGNNVKLWQERNDLRENFGMKIFEFKNKWCEVHRQVYWDNVSIIINK